MSAKIRSDVELIEASALHNGLHHVAYVLSLFDIKTLCRHVTLKSSPNLVPAYAFDIGLISNVVLAPRSWWLSSTARRGCRWQLVPRRSMQPEAAALAQICAVLALAAAGLINLALVWLAIVAPPPFFLLLPKLRSPGSQPAPHFAAHSTGHDEKRERKRRALCPFEPKLWKKLAALCCCTLLSHTKYIFNEWWRWILLSCG